MNNKIIEMKEDCHQLLESIDFFAQNLSFEQIASYGYQFIHTMLNLEDSAIYVLVDHEFVLKQFIGAAYEKKVLPYDLRIKRIATKFGRAMQKELELYFDKDFIEQEEITFGLPILVKDETVGLIFSRSKNIDLTNSQLSTFVNGINQLINKAAESAMNYQQFQEASAVLDRKIFNLLFINHSTKALMSEIDIEKLYALCIDVIRELTASSVTSFGLYDKVRKKIILKGYKDIVNYNEYYCEIGIKDRQKKPQKLIYHIQEDFYKLSEIFENPETFNLLEAEYVVLLVKDDILGFVTIGKRVSHKAYTDELLNQVESMGSSIYIAITNAQYISTIKMQKEELSTQFELMKKLNVGIKNINTCESVDELCHIALQTLGFGFEIEKSMIILKSNDQYYIESHYGFELEKKTFAITEFFRNNCLDQTYFEAMRLGNHVFFGEKLSQAIGESNCIITVPIQVSNVAEADPTGFLVVVKTVEALRNRQVTIVETLANSISPTIKQISERVFIEERFIKNEKVLFLDALKLALHQREIYFTDFLVQYKKLASTGFEEPDLSMYKDMKVFVFGGYVFNLTHDDADKNLFEAHLTVFDQDSFIDEFQKMK